PVAWMVCWLAMFQLLTLLALMPPRGGVGGSPATRGAGWRQSTYSELTDSPKAMRRMVSASSSATLSWRIRPQALAASDSGMVSVTTSSSRADFAMLSIAGPESTGWVQYATTLVAPCAFSAAAAAHRVPAVSTMSSTSTQTLPATSPMMFITVATLA